MKASLKMQNFERSLPKLISPIFAQLRVESLSTVSDLRISEFLNFGAKDSGKSETEIQALNPLKNARFHSLNYEICWSKQEILISTLKIGAFCFKK